MERSVEGNSRQSRQAQKERKAHTLEKWPVCV